MFPGQSASANQSIRATGGSITEISGYKVHSFLSSSNFIIQKGVATVEYVVAAGGGPGGPGGANVGGGGGGGGGVLTSSVTLSTSTQSVVVGAGGPANSNGSGSSFGNVSTSGGGYGSGSDNRNAGSGGSGGGTAGATPNVAGNGTTLQGTPGGYGIGRVGVDICSAGGGGGGGLPGQSSIANTSDAFGGTARVSTITGSSVGYSRGGNGRSYLGGSNGNSGAANTGNGGDGGAGSSGVTAGTGGSGIVVVRYRV